MIKTILKPVKTMKKPIKTQKTRISWFFQWFFHILMKKPGFLVFSEKNEKTINPGYKQGRPWGGDLGDKSPPLFKVGGT